MTSSSSSDKGNTNTMSYSHPNFKRHLNYQFGLIKNRNNNEIILNKIYKVTNEDVMKIYKAKKNKDFELKEYQDNLLLSIGDLISRDSYERLERKFRRIRKANLCTVENNYPILRKEELKEEKIVKRINHQKDYYINYLAKTAPEGFGFVDNARFLPKIEFVKTFFRPKKEDSKKK